MGTHLIRVRPEELDELGAARIRVRPDELDQPELLAPPSLEGFPEVRQPGRVPVTIGGLAVKDGMIGKKKGSK